MNKVATFFRESNIARFLIPLGLALIIFGIVVLIINIKNQNYIKIESTISKVKLVEDAYIDNDGNQVDATYNIYVKYIVGDKEYEEELSGVSKHEVGDKMIIYYNPNDPSEITQTKSVVLPIIMIAGGLVSLTGGILSGINSVKRYKKMKEQEKGWEKNNG